MFLMQKNKTESKKDSYEEANFVFGSGLFQTVVFESATQDEIENRLNISLNSPIRLAL